MAKRVFKTDLSVKGIENLKKELMNYRDNELPKKLDLFVKKVLRVEQILPTILMLRLTALLDCQKQHLFYRGRKYSL